MHVWREVVIIGKPKAGLEIVKSASSRSIPDRKAGKDSVEMVIKLRQWIGRGIRRETDTCIFSILDSRAAGRYKNDILATLPDMPVTDRIEDVGRFLLSNKKERYFEG